MNDNKKNSSPRSLKIGLNIRKWRELKGIKQEQLATQLGISNAALSNIENDKADVSLRRIEDIARCLDLEVTKLFKNPMELLLPPSTDKT